MLRHVIHRTVVSGYTTDGRGKQTKTTRQEIAREVAVCKDCKRKLDGGMTLGELWVVNALARAQAAATAPAPKERRPQRLMVGYEAEVA